MISLLFDLDGTLTDSGEGIMNAATYALEKLGVEVPEREALRVFVGPPLVTTFSNMGFDREHVDLGIRYFRELYNKTGKYENVPYDGIEELLKKCKQHGYKMYVATSKPEVVAIEVLKKFSLDSYFDVIAGASFDHSRESKTDVLSYLLEKEKIQHPVMIGDTVFDVRGAKNVNIPCIGVTWGYGNEQEMVDAGAISIAHSMEELFDLISSMNN